MAAPAIPRDGQIKASLVGSRPVGSEGREGRETKGLLSVKIPREICLF